MQEPRTLKLIGAELTVGRRRTKRSVPAARRPHRRQQRRTSPTPIRTGPPGAGWLLGSERARSCSKRPAGPPDGAGMMPIKREAPSAALKARISSARRRNPPHRSTPRALRRSPRLKCISRAESRAELIRCRPIGGTRENADWHRLFVGLGSLGTPRDSSIRPCFSLAGRIMTPTTVARAKGKSSSQAFPTACPAGNSQNCPASDADGRFGLRRLPRPQSRHRQQGRQRRPRRSPRQADRQWRRAFGSVEAQECQRVDEHVQGDRGQ